MTNEQLQEIRERCDAATPGPWKVIEKGNSVPSYAVVTIPFDCDKQKMICQNMSPKTANAAFIAHAREDIPALLAANDKLTDKLVEANAQIEWDNKKVHELTAELASVTAEREEAIGALEDMANQFAYEVVCNQGAAISTGGLSALEKAFGVLGWSDPLPTPERECQFDGCHQHASCGTPTPDGYKRLCWKHGSKYFVGAKKEEAE